MCRQEQQSASKYRNMRDAVRYACILKQKECQF